MKTYQKNLLLLLLLMLPFSVMLAQTSAQPCLIEATVDGEPWLPGNPANLSNATEVKIKIIPNPDFEGVTLLSAKLDLVVSQGGRNSKVAGSFPFKKMEDGSLEAKMGRSSGTAGNQITYVIEAIKIKQGKKMGLAKLPLAQRSFIAKS
jgi:hypothetical protein